MGPIEITLIMLILLLGVFAFADNGKHVPPPKEEDKDVKRIRQMQEWDRFDESRKEKD